MGTPEAQPGVLQGCFSPQHPSNPGIPRQGLKSTLIKKKKKKALSLSSDSQISDTIAHNGAKTVTFISLFLIVLNLELIDRTDGNDTFRTVMVGSDNLSISPMVY